MRIILLGAPGAGKGTQAQIISEKTGAVPVSTGKIIRTAVKDATPVGLIAKGYIDAGRLVPDDLVIAMLKERLGHEGDECICGYILDGFPRNIHQAQALDRMGVEIDLVIDIEVSDEDVVRRLCGRRVCEACNASYNIDVKPSSKGDICELCDGALIVRRDDTPEVVLERLRIYHAETQPLVEYYRAAGKLREVQSCERVEDTAARVLAALEAHTV